MTTSDLDYTPRGLATADTERKHEVHVDLPNRSTYGGPTGGLIYKKIPEAAKKIGFIEKTEKNAFHGFEYRGIDAVMSACGGVFADIGLTVQFNVVETVLTEIDYQQNKKGWRALSLCEFTFWAEDGSFLRCYVRGEGQDKGDKAVTKSYAIAFKYCLMYNLCIPLSKQDDPDGEVVPDLSTTQNKDKPKARQSRAKKEPEKPKTAAKQKAKKEPEKAAATPAQPGGPLSELRLWMHKTGECLTPDQASAMITYASGGKYTDIKGGISNEDAQDYLTMLKEFVETSSVKELHNAVREYKADK